MLFHMLTRHSVQATPTGSDIERFLTATVRLPTPTKDDNPKASDVQVPTYAWVEKTEKSVIDACILYYDEFEISKHNRMHLEACKIEMLKDGRITKQEKRKRGSTGTRASGRQRTKVKSI